MKKVDASINNSFEQSLVDNGYKWSPDTWKNSIRGFQKRITDIYGTKYFITGYHYNHHKLLDRADIEDEDSYSFDCQFTIERNGKDHTIDLHFNADFLENKLRPITTILEVEEFYEKFFRDFNCDYYETIEN